MNLFLEINSDWKEILNEEFSKKYMIELKAFLELERSNGKVIYPKKSEIFNAFNATPFDKVKVVIIGQDPYHGPDQAHGLCFSVNQDVKIPPSLVNIFKELKEDLGIETSDHGNLSHWAEQGVLLLNSSLTVEQAQAGSHRKIGWEHFTDAVIDKLNESRENLVFILWGNPAQKKASSVDTAKHLVLKAPHPSPLSSYRGFFGCKHFSKCNVYLKSKKIDQVNW